MEPIQIDNPDAEETIEVPLSEYEAFKAITAGIAEQNTIVLGNMNTLTDGLNNLHGEMVASSENLTAMFASLADAIRNIQINVNVPEQPAPQVTVNVPQGPAPKVTVQESADKPLNSTITFNRNQNGAITSAKLKTE